MNINEIILETMNGDNVCDILKGLGYSGAFNIYDIRGVGRKACYCTLGNTAGLVHEINTHDGKVARLKNSQDIAILSWKPLCQAVLTLLNKNFKCFNGITYLKMEE